MFHNHPLPPPPMAHTILFPLQVVMPFPYLPHYYSLIVVAVVVTFLIVAVVILFLLLFVVVAVVVTFVAVTLLM